MLAQPTRDGVLCPGFGFRVSALGFRVSGLGFRVYLKCWVQSGFIVTGFEFN